MSDKTKLYLGSVYIICLILYHYSFKFQYLVGFIWAKIYKRIRNIVYGFCDFLDYLFYNPVTKSVSEFHNSIMEARAEQRVQQYFGEYEEPQSGWHTLNTDSSVIVGMLFREISKKYEWKFGSKLTDTDKSVIVAAFLSNSVDYNDLIDYVNDHPFVSAYLIDKFVELYHSRKIENKPINFLEIQMFIETAKFFK